MAVKKTTVKKTTSIPKVSTMDINPTLPTAKVDPGMGKLTSGGTLTVPSLGIDPATGNRGTWTPGAAGSPSLAPIAPWNPTTNKKGQIKLGGGVTASKGASSLYIDPSPAYAPLLQFLDQQKTLATERYKKNQANIESLFGTLSDIAVKDQAKINEQFTQSITDQQMAVAKRNAEAQAATNTGLAQAAITGAESGGGEAMAQNPTQVATADAAGRSNEYQTVWENLQRVNQNQAVVDAQNRQAGYGQQKVGAISKLAENLETRLMEIGGNTAQVQSDIAKAKIDMTSGVAQANYGEMQSAKEYQRQLALAAARSSAPKPKTYSNNYVGTVQYLADSYGPDFANGLANGIDTIDAGSFTDWTKAYAAWNKSYGTQDGQALSPDIKTRVKQYFQYNYNKPKSASSGSTTYTQ